MKRKIYSILSAIFLCIALCLALSACGETPGGETPCGETPGGETPGGETPGGETPGGETPGGETPGGDTPGGDTPGGETPGGETLGGDTPGGETPGGETPGGDTLGEDTPGFNAQPSTGLAYEKSSDGIYYILVGIGSCKDTNIVIPSTYNDLPVKEIGPSAFYGCYSLESVTIGNSVTSIGSSAFRMCINLESVTIGNSVTSIDDDAFYYCTSLEEIYFNATAMSDLSSYNCVFYNAGKNGNGIKVIIGKNVTKIPAYILCPHSSYSSYSPKITSVEFEAGSVCEIIGSYAFYDCDSLTSVTIPGSVTSIGDWAFRNCTSLTSVTIPDSVTSIGSGVFYKCTSLTSITLPFIGATKGGTSNTHFGYIFGTLSYSENSSYVPSSLITVVITGGTSIASSAFYNCKKLESITIPDSVTSIGNYAFSSCSSLTSITIPDSVTFIGNYAFRECTSLESVTVPDSVTSIGTDAFGGCSSLERITLPFVGSTIDETNNTHFGYIFGASSYINNSSYIPSSLKTVVIIGGTSIASCAFYSCYSLESVTIGNSVTFIGSNAFYICSSLESINVSEQNSNYKSIDGNLYTKDGKTLVQYAIGKKATSFTIPNSVTSIGENAFSGCTSLCYNEYDNAYYLGNYANPYVFLLKVKNTTIPSCDINENTKVICSYAFQNCTSLASIEIPDNVTSIGENAFSGCTSLESITIGNGVETIGARAFRNCTSLASIEIPDSVTFIGNYAFRECTSLESVTIGNGVKSVGAAAFYGCKNLVRAYYNGTASEWNGISINSFSNSYLINATRYYYSATRPTGSGNYWYYDNGEIKLWE